jgi:hypothetical protein
MTRAFWQRFLKENCPGPQELRCWLAKSYAAIAVPQLDSERHSPELSP